MMAQILVAGDAARLSLCDVKMASACDIKMAPAPVRIPVRGPAVDAATRTDAIDAATRTPAVDNGILQRIRAHPPVQ